jgi:UDPglucose 6-dehydrogenase
MNITVVGLWHLGSVTAACLALAGHKVIGIEADEKVLAGLKDGKAPLFEPGLDDLIKKMLTSGQLTFTADRAEGLKNADILWVTIDTPVDENDIADTEFVVREIESCFKFLPDRAVIAISSQLPVGSTAAVRKLLHKQLPKSPIEFAYVPENLRLGKAIDCFMKPDRYVVGTSSEAADKKLRAALAPITDRVESMRIESAEMTKHAINAFLATSVVFANELATICEQVNADAKEVERGLKTEMRIGPLSYLSPGSAFAGGTLARDCRFLEQRGREHGKTLPLISSVLKSNAVHKRWPEEKLTEILGSLKGRRVAVLGLTYKAQTSTLRRSAAVETCQALHSAGALVQAFDPGVKELPEELSFITLAKDIDSALRGADVLLVQTQWPEFRQVTLDSATNLLKDPVIVDPNGFLAATFQGQPKARYYVIGRSATHA